MPHPTRDAPPPDGGYLDLVLDDDPPPAAAAALGASTARAQRAPRTAAIVVHPRRGPPRTVRGGDLALLLAGLVALGLVVAVLGPRVAHPVAGAPEPGAPSDRQERVSAAPAPAVARGLPRRPGLRAARSPTGPVPSELPPPPARPEVSRGAASAAALPAADGPAAVFTPAPVPRPAEPPPPPEEALPAVPSPAPPPTADGRPEEAGGARDPEPVAHKPRLADATCLRDALAVSAAGPGAFADAVKVRLEVNAAGVPSGVELLAGASDPVAADAIRESVRACRFMPATDAAGRPVSAWHVLEIAFVPSSER